MRFNDAVSGLFFLLFGVGMIVIADGFPGFPGQRFGPALFPSLLGGGLIAAGGLLIVQGWRSGGGVARLDPALLGRGGVSVALVVLTIIAHVLLGERLGFAPISLLTLVALQVWFGVRPLTAAAVAAATTAVIWWFFAIMLRVPLPRGVLTGVI
ncbi:MAG: tripartite tricarboxylate transporter TctB family protein [Rubrimonas sp.]